MLLNKHNFAVADFVSKEQSRYTLNSMHVSNKGTCATDGHQLVRVSLPAMKHTHFPTIEGVVSTNGDVKPFLLDVAAAKQIGKAIPKKQSAIPVLEHALVGEPTGNNACLAVTDLKNPQVFRPRVPEGQFPNVDAVIPKDPPTFEIAVNAQLLGNILKAAAAFSSDDTHKDVLLRFHGKNSAMSVHCRNAYTEQTFMAILMPLSISEPKHYGIETVEPETAK